MSDNITYVLVEVDGDLSETNIREDINDLGGAYYVAQTTTVSMKRLEEAGTPVIYFP